MELTLADLRPLLPILITTATSVVVMLAIAIRRHYAATVSLAIVGLLLAAIAALILLPSTNQQVTPLLLIDGYSLFFTAIICSLAFFVAIFSFPYLHGLNDQREEFVLLLTVATIGAIVLASSNHFVSTIIGMETLSMSLYGMVAYPLHCKESAKFPLEASVKYLILSAVATGLMLFGMALAYAQTGTLSFADLLQPASRMSDSISQLAIILIVAGMAFKLSLAPFHMWTPDVYEGAPIPATTYLATVGKASMVVVLLRFVEQSNGLAFESVTAAISLVAALSIIGGNLLALMQDNLKRILAYSSIAHMGYLLIALLATYFADGTVSIEAVSFYLLAYVIMSLGAFGVTSVVSASDKEFDAISDFTGLFWRAPWLAAIFTGMLLSLAGIPLTIGFIGKFYLFAAGVEAGLWVLVAVLILGSGIGLYYYLRIVYRMLLPEDGHADFRIAGAESISSYGVLAILFLLLIVLGVYPGPIMDLLVTLSAAV